MHGQKALALIWHGLNHVNCPPSGVFDPEFSPYHHQVFEFLKLRDKYAPK